MSENSSGEVDSIESEIQKLIRDQGRESVLVRRLQLYKFFRAARAFGYLGSFDSQTASFDPLLAELTEKMRADQSTRRFSARRFTEFNYRSIDKFSLSTKYIDPIRQHMVNLKTFNKRSYSDLRQLWRDTMGVDAGYQPHLYRRFSRYGVPRTVASNCRLLGDYLLFTADVPGYAMPTFVRFYVHETGGVRCLCLRLDDLNHRISSKGWAINQQNSQVHVTGYLEERRAKGEVVCAGGTMCLTVSYDERHHLTHALDDIITQALVMFYYAPYTQDPIASRGILVRLKGFENQGGRFSQPKEKRNRATFSLHTKLANKFGRQLTLKQCSKLLSRVSGLPVEFFMQDDGAQSIFNNYPNTSANVKQLPIAPLSIQPPPKHPGFYPKADLFIDANNPPKEFSVRKR
ncbi:hypothetical protein [uncultured Tateyamaria sp.]|uniref:hypothetical protein n=1 Tax=uncultured Tateyamaria sp. TaxID=455651 RepID=UPI002631589C|nr:hypothetical protein [uncultured Tateyamaria sp.]